MKASGRLNIIENKQLLDNILYFYQEDVPFLNMLNTHFTSYKVDRLGPMLDQKLVIDKNGNGNWEEVLRQPELQNALRRATGTTEIIKQYDRTILMAKQIVSDIEKELD